MAKMQIDFDADEDKIIDIYKLVNHLKTKQEAIKRMVKYFDVEVVPKTMKKKEYRI